MAFEQTTTEIKVTDRDSGESYYLRYEAGEVQLRDQEAQDSLGQGGDEDFDYWIVVNPALLRRLAKAADTLLEDNEPVAVELGGEG